MSVAAVVYMGSVQARAAADLAQRCGLRLIDASAYEDAKARELKAYLAQALGQEMALVFLLDAAGLRLHATGELDCSIRADFHGPTVTYRRKQGGGKGQMIAKAVGLKSGALSVLDCTAGLGRDAFVLASLGCGVTLLERIVPVVVLLEDALAQAKDFAALEDAALRQILGQMELVQADALSFLKATDHGVADVVYLDPMFPVRGKSALVKKEMQLFHHLVGQDTDADGLLAVALEVAGSRVVVKRPRIAPRLAGPEPNLVMEGKSNRFDIYLV